MAKCKCGEKVEYGKISFSADQEKDTINYNYHCDGCKRSVFGYNETIFDWLRCTDGEKVQFMEYLADELSER